MRRSFLISGLIGGPQGGIKEFVNHKLIDVVDIDASASVNVRFVSRASIENELERARSGHS